MGTQRPGGRVIGKRLEQDAPVMGVVVLEADQAEDRRPNVRMIAEDLAEGAPLKYAGTDHAEPGLGDFLLEVAVVPSEAGVFDKAALEVGRNRWCCTAPPSSRPRGNNRDWRTE